ncbi:MAG: hypothetical protein AVDCRST_MAG23-860 [uncultured Sphingosinicella sp.]|uniref:Uncharacterized protein n=1 Tax=uncultured Sphingosinicella sp. TaxID=478748 RepID=A0A6J4TPC8_9SPHN|nr:MAG: hypothetical protein AVDCRST_MAG23-860 [uncultured Sphingosinicella sp.]
MGRMFGPGGAEMGLLFTIVRDGKGSAGQIAALKHQGAAPAPTQGCQGVPSS